MSSTSLAVHEKAHETGFATRKAWMVRVPVSYSVSKDIYTKLGFRKTMITKQNGEFADILRGALFEEAFVEETATRWREEAIVGHKLFGDRIWPTTWGADLPRRYHTYSHELLYDGLTETNVVIPTFAAYGMDILSKYPGTDFYQKLRNIPYTEDGLKDGLQIMKEVTGQ